MPAGRPSDYSVELADDICRLLAEGKSMVEFAPSPRCPTSRISIDGCEGTKDFRDSYVSAREQQAHTITDRAVEMRSTAIG